MTEEQVAKTLNAYLLGDLALQNKDLAYGPFLLKQQGKWQLDSSNDYWLRFEGDPTLSWRYPYQEAIGLAMVALFEAKFPIKQRT